MVTRRVLAIGGAIALALILAPVATAARASVQVLSGRANLISAGDALVAVDLPAGTDASKVRVTLGSRDVTSSFALRPNGRYEGLVERLQVGDNVLTARLPGGATARTTIMNHPNGGPVFSGPQ